MKKLTMVSVCARGLRAAAFVEAEVHPDGKVRVPRSIMLEAFHEQHGVDLKINNRLHMIGG